MSAPVPTLPLLPRLSDRHRAMLQEMGVPIWWPTAADAVGTGTAAPSDPATKDERRATAVPDPVCQPVEPTRPPPNHPVPTSAPGAALDHPARWLPNLAALEAAVHDCSRCGLAQRRQRAVPGMGDPRPDWLIIGEAPGEEEDRQGLPFVGRAGQLLDRMLAAMGLTREHRVYIANVIKCRPPLNRNPDPLEIAQCSPYLLRQVELLQPKVIIAMGRFAAQTVLAEGGALSPEAARQWPLGKLRGQVHRVTLGGLTLPVVVTYHPAYLLRSPAEKGKAWADLCLALDTMDGLHPARAAV